MAGSICRDSAKVTRKPVVIMHVVRLQPEGVTKTVQPLFEVTRASQIPPKIRVVIGNVRPKSDRPADEFYRQLRLALVVAEDNSQQMKRSPDDSVVPQKNLPVDLLPPRPAGRPR